MLTVQEIEKLANLCRISLAEDEKERFTADITAILAYVAKLGEVSVSKELEILAAESNLRNDNVIGRSLEEQKDLIERALNKQNNLIRTKPVF